MLEMKITITATELAAAINNLAMSFGHAEKSSAERTNCTEHTESACVSADSPRTAAPATPTVPVAAPAPTAPAQASAVPTAAPQYTLEMIANAGAALVDAGKLDQLMQLLGKFGVATLTELAPENYGAIAGELRALGATI